MARELAALSTEMDAAFFHFDYLKPDLGAVPKVDSALVFTMHSIEQVGRIEPTLFQAIAGVAKRVRCVHFEPFGWQAQKTGPVSEDHRNFMYSRKWNINFVEALVQAIKQFGIASDYMLTENFFPADWQNPTSLAIWSHEEKATVPQR